MTAPASSLAATPFAPRPAFAQAYPTPRPGEGARHRAPVLAGTKRALMWLIGFSGGFVAIEPAPYEFIIVLAALVFFATGTQLARAHLPLLVLLVLCDTGYLLGVMPVVAAQGTLTWTGVSCFMSGTALFFALAMGEDTEHRLAMLLKGYLAVAVAISVFGIVTYFHLLPGSDTFLFAQRSRATFKDPNVLAAFLVLPAMLALQRMMLGRLRDVLLGGVMTLTIAIELLLAFSRGAWAATCAAAAGLLWLSFLTAVSTRERLRVGVLAASGMAVVAIVIVAVIAVPQVRDLFFERASLIQSYDAGRFGRFGRHVLGAQLALEHPFGIGPLQFAKFFPEDPHNAFLDAFMAGGWLSGAVWFALIVTTLALGLRFAFVDAPWRRAYLALYVSFLALTGESYIIDVEHWRHYFLLLGTVWGLAVAAADRRANALRGGWNPGRRSGDAAGTPDRTSVAPPH